MVGASGFGAVMPQLPEPVHADTEVWTNVPCAQLLSDVREFEVVLDFTGTASNGILTTLMLQYKATLIDRV